MGDKTMTNKRMWQAVIVLGVMLALLALGMIGTAYADEGTLAIVVEGSEGASLAPAADEATIEPATPNPSYYRLFLSTTGGGTIGNLSYSDEDVLSYKPSTGQWVKTFDGTNAGLPASADIDAFAYRYQSPYSYMYMSFDTPVAVPGLGTVDDSDVVVYAVTLGNSSWSMVFDGSQYGLTTAAEDVDGFELATSEEFLISTTGNFSVPGHYGDTLTGGDEDIIRFVNNGFHFQLDGVNMGLTAGNDVTSLAYEYGGEGDRYYLVTAKPYNLPGAAGPAGTILLHTEATYGMDSNALWWTPVAVGKIDAFDLKMEP
jgi:hypothetical protein